ncbi:MAG: hypothetical protein KGL39_20330 [Patescibacteria group bacterium]|nr:hypothetical protein [Patescibacteria group bacterium]
MVIDGQPLIQHYPVSMARFGQNPFGENRYRIVLASTVTRLIGGQWPDGSVCYRWSVPLAYRGKGWILEVWDYCRQSRREWESITEPVSGWPLHGPYPSRGEYYYAEWEFDKGVDADNLDNIIGAIERGRSRSFQDVRDYAMREYQQEQKDSRRERDDEIRDSFTAFGVTPKAISSLTGVFRGTKTMAELKTAEELGLPVPQGRRIVAPSITGRRTADVRDQQISSTFLAA